MMMEKGKPKKILFVCLGNICRSPAAEGIFRRKVLRSGLGDRIQVASAATYGGHAGSPPDARMREAAAERGYTLDSRSRLLTRADFDAYDMIVVMDDANYEQVHRLAPSRKDAKKIYRMTDFIRQHDVDHIPDPYYEGRQGFEHVLDLLEDASEGLLDFLRAEKEEDVEKEVEAKDEKKKEKEDEAEEE